MALVIGGETSLKPLLTRTLQRLLYHTSFPVGFICLNLPPLDGNEDTLLEAGIDAAIGDYQLVNLINQSLSLPAALLHGNASRVAEDTALLSRLPIGDGRYRAFLRLPIDHCGVIVLLAPQIPDSNLPLTQMFQPVMANLARAIKLCRQHDMHVAQLLDARAQAEKSLLQSEHHLSLLIGMSPIGIIFSRDGVVVDANPASLRLFGCTHMNELRGQPMTDLIAPQRRTQVEERIKLRNAGLSENTEDIYEATGLKRDGTQFPIVVSSTQARLTDGVLTFTFILDITEQRLANERIRQLAYFDPLTQLPNRRLLLDSLEKTMSSSARNGQNGALILLDLDQFKTLNATRGHSAGDELLVEVAKRLRECVSGDDSLARIGGDEFVVVLEALSTDPSEASMQAQNAAEKIRVRLCQPYLLAEIEYHITPSIGIAMFCGHLSDLETLFLQVDTAMYQSKADGRNTVRFFDPAMQAQMEMRSKLESALRNALPRNEFQLHYQLQVGSASHPIGVEALLRWNNPVLGEVSTASFIPVTEETGMILGIGQWVLEQACAQLARWQSHPQLTSLSIAVNVSARQFHQATFVTQVEGALKTHGANPQQLKLELTESIIIENIEEAVEKMHALKALGVTLSLDDFGTGYSSLSYLKRLPFDQIKIDQSFVRDIMNNPSDAVMVRTIIHLATSFRMDVIAEGVETEEQYQFLRKHGCMSYQGYLFGKPMPVEQLEVSIRQSCNPPSE